MQYKTYAKSHTKMKGVVLSLFCRSTKAMRPIETYLNALTGQIYAKCNSYKSFKNACKSEYLTKHVDLSVGQQNAILESIIFFLHSVFDSNAYIS